MRAKVWWPKVREKFLYPILRNMRSYPTLTTQCWSHTLLLSGKDCEYCLPKIRAQDGRLKMLYSFTNYLPRPTPLQKFRIHFFMYRAVNGTCMITWMIFLITMVCLRAFFFLTR